jgi:peptide/nickel transport system permease protein
MKIKLGKNSILKNQAAVIATAAILLAVLFGFVLPAVGVQDPFLLSTTTELTPPSFTHLFGTDDLRRDYFSRTLHGLGTSLTVGVLAALTSASIGVVVGALAGFFGGRLDNVLMRVTEIFFVMPRFFLALVVLALFGPGLWKITLVIGILSWPGTARLVRALTLALREREYVVAAIALGASPQRVLLRHILPNTLGPIIVSASFEVSHAILLESSLSFLGLGDPQVLSLGGLMERGRPYLMSHWWIGLFPGILIFWIIAAFNMLGDALADFANPRMKER